ncbi:MAG: flavodoxin family protein [Candidatus Baldrarchaeia archaeon]
MIKVKILGICGSLRHGNSEFLLKKSLEAAKSVAPEYVETEFYTLAGKTIYTCDFCLLCLEYKDCMVKDDFHELKEKWLEADGIIYSIPVYHLGMPAHLKAFIDRLGQTVYGSSGDIPPKFMKVIGVIAQGTDLGGGAELTMIQAITHALVMGSIPIAGDGPESYIGAYGWTKRSWFTDSFERLLEQKDFDAETTLRAAESLGRRVAYLSLIVKNGAYLMKDLLKKDPKYNWYLSKIENDMKKK